MRVFFGFLAFFFLFIIFSGALTVSLAIREFEKPILITESTLFEITRGDSVNHMAANLWRAEILDSPHIFQVGTRLLKMDKSLKAGEYELQPNMSPKDLLDLFQSGKTYQRQFTIREGLTSHEIENLLLQIEDINSKNIRLEPMSEGALLPETYSYTKGESIIDVIHRMEKAMSDVKSDLCPSEPCWSAPLTSWGDVINLAAIVEKETAVASERGRVAGVFINRLNKGMRLQTDPTVIYALTQGKPENEGKGPLGRRLLRKDLAFDSPYNTYVYEGLPPGPIANPGRAAIEAVLAPEAHDYFYFVADGTGGHAFGKTLKEHNANVAKWRKIRRAQGQK